MKQTRKQFPDEMSLFPVPCFLMEMKSPAGRNMARILKRLAVAGWVNGVFMEGEQDQKDFDTSC